MSAVLEQSSGPAIAPLPDFPIRGPGFPAATAGDSCARCGAQLVQVGRVVQCPSCQAAVSPEHPLQRAIDVKIAEAEAKQKAEQERRAAVNRAESERRQLEQEKAQLLLESTGGKIGSLETLAGDVDYRVAVELILPVSVFQAVRDEITRRERQLGESILLEFKGTQEYKQAAVLHEQIAQLGKELVEAQAVAQAAELAHKDALKSGTPCGATRDRAASSRGLVTVLQDDLASVKVLLEEAKAAAGRAYAQHYLAGEIAALNEQLAETRKLEESWLEAALPELSALLVGSLTYRNLQMSDGDVRKRTIKKTLTFS